VSLFAANNWTDRATARLGECISGNNSAGETSRILTAEFGVVFTRNACIGKAKRLGLTFGGSPKNGHDTKPRPPRPKPAPRLKPLHNGGQIVRTDVPATPEPTPQGDVSTGCRWLHGDAFDRNFCGADRQGTSRYCEHHHARCYRPAPPTKTKRLDRQVTRLANFYT
jgi:hypothetical protein